MELGRAPVLEAGEIMAAGEQGGGFEHAIQVQGHDAPDKVPYAGKGSVAMHPEAVGVALAPGAFARVKVRGGLHGLQHAE